MQVPKVVLSGLELRRLSTDDEGIAQNTLWVTDRRGRKLSNFQAEMLAERIGDFVVYCTPDSKVGLSGSRIQGRQLAHLLRADAFEAERKAGPSRACEVALPQMLMVTCSLPLRQQCPYHGIKSNTGKTFLLSSRLVHNLVRPEA